MCVGMFVEDVEREIINVDTCLEHVLWTAFHVRQLDLANAIAHLDNIGERGFGKTSAEEYNGG